MPRADISYDFEDFGKDQGQLEEKYGAAGHPEYTLQNWRDLVLHQAEVAAKFNGYWDWVVCQIEADDDAIEGAGEPEGQADQATQTDEEQLFVQDIDQFAHLIAGWHKGKVALLEHMLKIPEGTAIEVQIDDEQPIKVLLVDDVRQAFRAGIVMALTELGKLPFSVAVEMDSETKEVPAPAASTTTDGAANDAG